MDLHLRATGTDANLFKRKKRQKARNHPGILKTELSVERGQNTNTMPTSRHFQSRAPEPVMYQRSRNGGVKLSSLLGGKEQLHNS